jgi:hypothetical protein
MAYGSLRAEAVVASPAPGDRTQRMYRAVSVIYVTPVLRKTCEGLLIYGTLML